MDISKGSYVCIKRTDVFTRSWINQLEHYFQPAVRALMNVFALSFKFESKPENSKKPKSLDTLKSKK